MESLYNSLCYLYSFVCLNNSDEKIPETNPDSSSEKTTEDNDSKTKEEPEK